MTALPPAEEPFDASARAHLGASRHDRKLKRKARASPRRQRVISQRDSRGPDAIDHRIFRLSARVSEREAGVGLKSARHRKRQLNAGRELGERRIERGLPVEGAPDRRTAPEAIRRPSSERRAIRSRPSDAKPSSIARAKAARFGSARRAVPRSRFQPEASRARKSSIASRSSDQATSSLPRSSSRRLARPHSLRRFAPSRAAKFAPRPQGSAARKQGLDASIRSDRRAAIARSALARPLSTSTFATLRPTAHGRCNASQSTIASSATSPFRGPRAKRGAAPARYARRQRMRKGRGEPGGSRSRSAAFSLDFPRRRAP